VIYCEEDFLQLSGLQHFKFCRRQWALIHIENQWAENFRTTDGAILHENAHNGGWIRRRIACDFTTWEKSMKARSSTSAASRHTFRKTQ